MPGPSKNSSPHVTVGPTEVSPSDFYQVVGVNNRNLLVQSKRVAPYHEDLTKVQSFEPSSVQPGNYTKIKMDFKHATDREIILNDIRLQFNVDFTARTSAPVGKVLAVRGTDLIREMTVKINEDVVFHVDRRGELSMLYEMNNHKMGGDSGDTHASYLINAGNIPQGRGVQWAYQPKNNNWYSGSVIVDTNSGAPAASGTDLMATEATLQAFLTQPGEERHDGFARLIYDDTTNPIYFYKFNISLNQIIGPIFTRLHLRRIEYVQIELLFEPFLSPADCQNFLFFKQDPTIGNTVPHPYSVARITNLQIQQYRTTLLDGIHGFTLPDSRMLSWLMHRYSRREYTFDFDNQTYIDIQLKDWEIRTNIVRVWWMLAPLSTSSNANMFTPTGEPCEGYDYLSGVEIHWKNDTVLDLASTYDVYRHYILSDNKRYNFDDPGIRFARLTPNYAGRYATIAVEASGSTNTCPSNGFYSTSTPASTRVDLQVENYRTKAFVDVLNPSNLNKVITINTDTFNVGACKYEYPIYHVDLCMNVQSGVPGAEIIGGIVNDTSDYVIRIKRLSDRPQFLHTGQRTLWVWLEYQTLVNLSAGSNQFQRGSQIVTKQLNPQN